MGKINPNELVAKLSEDASTRKKRSIEIIHNICQEQYDRGSKDFSIATISTLSKEYGGPSEQTIRNKNGADYRAILKAWAEFSEGFATKQKAKQESTTADEILAGINDPTIRSLVGITLAENKKLKNENALLKHQTTLTIDKRDMGLQQRESLPTGSTEVLVARVEGLLPTEISALEHAVSEELLSRQGWISDAQGRVKMKGMQLYKAGYVTAIKKILSSYANK